MGDIMFGLFKKSKKDINSFLKDKSVLNIELNNKIDCIGDFTYNFIWQSKFDYNKEISQGITFKNIVELLKNNGMIYIKGNIGHRFCSSMGADLKYFGGSGGILNAGTIIVDGDIDTRCGISMVSGTIYINDKNTIKQPIGNIIEVESDIKNYKKYISITEYIERRHDKEKLLKPNKFDKRTNILILNDGIIRDTVGARLKNNVTIIINGNVDLSTGILMEQGKIIINGNAGKNTGVLLNGGTIVINGSTEDFTASEMKKGTILIKENAGKFLGAKKKRGIIYAKQGAPIPPTKKYNIDKNDKKILNNYGFIGAYYKFE